MAFRVDLANFRKFQRKFVSSGQRTKGIAQAGAVHVTLIQEAFEVGGVDPVSGSEGAWPDKKTPDPKKTRVKNPPARLFEKQPRLQDTGALVRSINFKKDGEGYVVGPAPLPYAAFHQFGAAIPMSRERRAQLISLGFTPSAGKRVIIIPRRQYIVFPSIWVQEIGEAYLSGRVEGTGNG